ncbi:multiple sugar transport system permease protein [Anaerocolumna jejuensis DSM 15929]|uniref:Multiple sugar transport system permease protein n=1 Tax=Anaerocolumna jejuensis DSM 15929 TaxID=1121322 RepID=A0A1M6MY44_9FIRM|nr:sugar ABC transporter permease [Anaerocolumna jejuensis]SHJ88358.1 multiple sugar transport system permease protein [Anaerocolumna jejuensis DSM 15929]
MDAKTLKKCTKRNKAERREEFIAYLFLLPNMIGFVIFTLIPVVWGLLLSFTNYDGFSDVNFTGLTNFKKLFTDGYFITSLKNNIFYTVFSVFFTLLFGLLLAVLLQKKLKGSMIFKTIFFFPQLTSSVAFGIIFVCLFRGNGPINGALQALGLANPPKWLTSTEWSMITITIVSIIKNMGYYMVLFLAGLQTIPVDLYEASSLDGASGWKQFKAVTLPMLSPTTFLCSIMCLINSFKVFDLVNIMTDGGPGRSSNVLVYRIYQEAFVNYKFGYASTYAVVLFLIVFVITMIQFRGQKKWVNY